LNFTGQLRHIMFVCELGRIREDKLLYFLNVFHCICTVRHIKIEITNGSYNLFWALTWVVGY